MKQIRGGLWRRFQDRCPRLYEAVEWLTFILAVGAFLLAVAERMS